MSASCRNARFALRCTLHSECTSPAGQGLSWCLQSYQFVSKRFGGCSVAQALCAAWRSTADTSSSSSEVSAATQQCPGAGSDGAACSCSRPSPFATACASQNHAFVPRPVSSSHQATNSRPRSKVIECRASAGRGRHKPAGRSFVFDSCGWVRLQCRDATRRCTAAKRDVRSTLLFSRHGKVFHTSAFVQRARRGADLIDRHLRLGLENNLVWHLCFLSMLRIIQPDLWKPKLPRNRQARPHCQWKD